MTETRKEKQGILMSVQRNPGNGMNREEVEISDMLTEIMTEKVTSLRNLP